jgi:hypothetical protein
MSSPAMSVSVGEHGYNFLKPSCIKCNMKLSSVFELLKPGIGTGGRTDLEDLQ